MKKHWIYSLSAIVALTSCDTMKKEAETVVEDAKEEVVELASQQTIDVDYMDAGIRPQDDFFQFSNGTWIKNNPVPPSESRWGSFNELDESNMKKLTKILEEAMKSSGEQGSMNQILGDYYASFTDMATRNNVGIEAIHNEIHSIKKMNSKKDLVSILAQQHMQGIGSLFGFGIGQDLKDVDNNIAYFGQGGIGLPNRDYYFSEDKAEILAKYEKHIIGMMDFMDYESDDAIKFAKSVVKFEKMLAEKMLPPAELRIPEKTYNKMSKEAMIKRCGNFDFEAYLRMIGCQSFDELVVGQPKFVDMVANAFDKVELEDWKNYLTWQAVNHYAGHLNDQLVNKNFDFYGKELSGKKEMKPLNKRAINEITGMEFSELLGKAFVEKHFSESAKNRVNEMVDNLLIVFRERIEALDWMSSETKKQALTKLNAIGRKLGYPSKWEDFSKLRFTKNDYVGNLKAVSLFSHRKNMAKLNQPVDKDEWGMPAHMVNAYYHPLLNEIAFPAGIMQAPFFSDDYEDAVNYGRIGMVIGHEFTHGFDDMGSKFAADGSFENWWTKADRELFEERTEKLGNTFAGFCPIDGHCVNPALTMGENIADLGGLTMAFHAYKRTKEYKSGVSKKGYTPAQRFFISYAQLWKINYTDEELKNRIANDPHSPGMYRVNGPLMNCPEFFEAFNVTEQDPMRNSSDKVSKIW